MELGGHANWAAALQHAYAARGFRGAGEWNLEVTTRRAQHEYVAPFDLARAYAMVEQRNETLRYLEMSSQTTWGEHGGIAVHAGVQLFAFQPSLSGTRLEVWDFRPRTEPCSWTPTQTAGILSTLSLMAPARLITLQFVAIPGRQSEIFVRGLFRGDPMLQVVVRLIGHSTIGRSTPAGNGVL